MTLEFIYLFIYFASNDGYFTHQDLLRLGRQSKNATFTSPGFQLIQRKENINWI